MTKKVKLKLVEKIAERIQSNKGQNVIILDLRKTGQNVCDYFIICHGTSNIQTQSIAENTINDIRKKLKVKPFNVEGMKNAEWILLDYGEVVAHIFLEDFRYFFHLEDLWADAKIISQN